MISSLCGKIGKALSGKKNVKVERVFGIMTQAVTNAMGDIEKRRTGNRKEDKEIV